MNKIAISSIQRGCVNDGAGLRTVFFLHGCNLRCPWCCNPETQGEEKIIFNLNKCLHFKGITSQFCNDCSYVNSGKDSKCHFGAVRVPFSYYEPNEILGLCRRDYDFFGSSGGGVTFSGGEPLLQAEALKEVFSGLVKDNIDIAVETALYLPKAQIKISEPYVNHYIIDLKLQPQMFLDKPDYINCISQNLNILNHKNCLFRLVCVKGMLKHEKQIAGILNKLEIKQLEILKAHNLAKTKFERLSRQFIDYSPDNDEYDAFAEKLTDSDIIISKLQI